MKMLWFLVFVFVVGCVRTQDLVNEVVVIRMTVPYEQQLQVVLNTSVEYILDFVPNSEQLQWPGRLSLSVDGGDLVHPALLTARQGSGAVSWQLPYASGGVEHHAMERSLCQIPNGYNDNSDCAGPSTLIPNGFSLHASTTCYVSGTLTVSAAPERAWDLPYQRPVAFSVAPSVPAVHYYSLRGDQDSVRIALASEDDVCVVVSVQNITCPILQTEEEVISNGLRMTMLRSAGVHISRHQYPKGFFIVVIVKGTDIECTGEEEERTDWLYQATLGILGEEEKNTNPNRTKQFTVVVNATLSRAQYAIAASVTFLVFLLFYASFLLLVYAQRWPWFAKHVRPLAPPAPSAEETLVSMRDSGAVSAAPARRRRDSTATFDSEDNSDTDDEEDIVTPPPSFSDHFPDQTPNPEPRATAAVSFETAATINVDQSNNGGPNAEVSVITTERQADGVSGANGADLNGQALPPAPEDTPYGLPSTLRLAALSRRGAKVIRARSDRYLQTMYVVAVFYALPVVQFVVAFQVIMNVSGSLDICYYNFLCAHPVGQLSDFNHVLSNLGYLMLGALFMLQVRRRRRRRKRLPRSEEYGIPAHYGLLSSLGAGMMVVALLSASYHICPNQLNFQFDTAFMYVLAVISMVKIYQSRHPDVNARAHATFGVLAVLIALVVWGVLGGGALFWALFTVLHLFTFMILSLRIYYVGQFRLERSALQSAARSLAAVPKHGVRPLYKPRLVMLLIANSVNWMFALYGLWQQGGDFAGHLLQVLLGNALLYMVFYLVMKLMHGERPRWYAWCYLAGATLAWVPALYFFVSGSSDWSSTPAMSRHKNHECYVMHFYDSHDLWHLLSAVALYLSFNAMMTWDDGLAAVKRTEIAVF